MKLNILPDILKTPRITQAFEKVDRKDFVIAEHLQQAYEDIPLPIGYGQTISQPTTVVFMLELLQPQEGMKVLDVGSGSAWTVALLSYIVGESGKVIGVERVPKLVDFGRKNINKYTCCKNAKIEPTDLHLGYEPEAPYDRILVSASAEQLPLELVLQLKVHGTMVLPIKNSVWKVERKGEDLNDLVLTEYPGFVFVPLVA